MPLDRPVVMPRGPEPKVPQGIAPAEGRRYRGPELSFVVAGLESLRHEHMFAPGSDGLGTLESNQAFLDQNQAGYRYPSPQAGFKG